jgi:hypothetical protein
VELCRFWSRAWINNRNIERGIGEIEMSPDPKHNGSYDDVDRAKRARRHQEEVLDDGLKNTFPASVFDCNIGREENEARVCASGTQKPASR